jgi:hypothetical protein
MSVRARSAIAVTAGALLLGGIAVANAADDRHHQEAGNASALADGATRSFVAGTAGSVEITRSGDSLALVRAMPSPGFAVEVESGAGREIEVKFSNGATGVDFNAELEDGEVRVRVRADDGAAIPSTSTATTPDDRVPDATTPTAPDDDDFSVIENSGPGRLDSGPGNFEDRGDGDDDRSNSGPGASDDDDHSNSGSSGEDDRDDDAGGGDSGPDD